MSTDTKTVLYVEDNPANLELVIRFLARYPAISVQGCVSAEEGLDRIQQQRPDLILLDINLPGMNGYEMIKHLKHADDSKNIPVIALTANVMMQDIENGFSSGFDDYMTKPLDLKIFRTTVLRYLGLDSEDTG